MENHFDLYSVTKFDLSNEIFSSLRRVDPVIRLVGGKGRCDGDGFLDFKLSLIQAVWLCRVLRRMEIEAYPISEEYKVAKFSKAAALHVAHEFFEVQRRLRPDLELGSVVEMTSPAALGVMTYGFISFSPILQLEGNAPGGVVVAIDKTSGTIWDSNRKLDHELMLELINNR